ncbi:mechanosensitive ion channel family protein [Candidatus Woesearchaeota archaeon]|nr:mechanosensitive ion channel family protein [Candidatus Woesearchaeota archaeon]
MAEINGTFIGDVSFQNFLLFIFVIILTFVLGSILNIMIIRLLKEKVRPVIYKGVSKIVMYGIYAVGLYFAFQKIINFNITASLAAIGILGVAMLLPMVPVLQNIAAGIVIALERPFMEEDIIELGGGLCKVKDIMLRKTKLRSLDGKIIFMPNLSFITGTPVINYSKGEFIKIVLNIDITKDSDREKAKKIIKDICKDRPNILPNVPQKKMNTIMKILEIPKNFFKIPRNVKALTPKVFIKGVTKDKVSLEIWFWTWDITLKEQITSFFYRDLIQKFDEEKIKFG